MKLLTIILLISTFMFSSIDVNNATLDEFTILKGIGIKKAKKIIEYRETIKCFKSIDELINVKGIGDKTLDKNRENIVIGKCKNK